jgi:hypothetical protein
MANRVVEHNLLDDKNKNSEILPEDIPQPKTSEKNIQLFFKSKKW